MQVVTWNREKKKKKKKRIQAYETLQITSFKVEGGEGIGKGGGGKCELVRIVLKRYGLQKKQCREWWETKIRLGGSIYR